MSSCAMSSSGDAPGPAHDGLPLARPDRARTPGRWGLLPGRWRLRQPPDWRKEVGFLTVSFVAFALLRRFLGPRYPDECGQAGSLGTAQRIACDRALDIWHFERALGTGFELDLNRALNRLQPLARMADYWLAAAPLIVTIGVLGWIYRRHPLQYRGLRTVLYGSGVFAAIASALFVVAAPRMLTGIGFRSAVTAAGNWFTVMPSLEIVWAAWTAIAIYQLSRSRWLRYGVLGYPVATFVIAVAAGHDFWVTALGGLAALWLGFLLQRLLFGQPAVDLSLEQPPQPAVTSP